VFACRFARFSALITRRYSSRTWSYSLGWPSCRKWPTREITFDATWNGASAADGINPGVPAVVGLLLW
jgi:hypothetical protein